MSNAATPNVQVRSEAAAARCIILISAPKTGGPDGGGKGVAALRNSAYFAIDPVVLAAITQTGHPLTASGAAKTPSPAPYRCAEKVIESACVINTAYAPYAISEEAR